MSEALNIIKAHFGAQREVTTAPVWQYDYGKKLEIDGIPNLPSTFEIHYSNSKARGTAKRWIGYDGVVDVLDEYLLSGADIWGFIFLHEGEDDGQTEYVIHIPVKERSEAEDSEPTPVQQDIVTEAIAALNAAVAQCGAYVEHYPTVIDGYWYVWDEATEQFVTTGVPATGNGIASAQLNQDYTLTLTFTDGSSFTTPISIRGAQGEKGDTGAVPDFSIGTVTTLPAESSASASITGTQEQPVLNLSIPQGQDGAITNLDATLTISGKAADAKATGDEINYVYTGKPIHVVETVNKLNPEEIVSGTHIDTDGEYIPDARFDLSGFITIIANKTGVAFTGKNAAGTARVCLPITRVMFFDSNKNVLSYQDSVSSNTVVAIPSAAAFVRIEWRIEYNNRSLMVEFVDSISEISAEFVPYEEASEYSHGINYLDEKQQEILERLDVAESEIERIDDISEQTEDNADKIADILGVYNPISNLCEFVHGYIRSSDGQIITSGYDYRVATSVSVTADQTYNVTVANGFRAYLYTFVSPYNNMEKSWKTGAFKIEKGTVFRMTIARVVEDTSEVADIDVFCAAVQYSRKESITYVADKLNNIDSIISYGITWDWWISSNSIDAFGNVYIGYIDTDGYSGVLKRQPDGTMQYKRLEIAENNDDHNGSASIVLNDGRILVIGAFGHSKNNHIICHRSKEQYSIDDMDCLSFDIPQTNGWKYACTYSQIFQYDGVLYDFLRCVSTKTGETTKTGYICLKSTDNGDTWTAYKAIEYGDPYITFSYVLDDQKLIKGVIGQNPSSGVAMLKGFTFDMSTEKFHDLSGTEIGELVELNGGSVDDENIAHYTDMTDLIMQGSSTNRARLFTVCKTPKADTVFLYAVATDSSMSDFVYKIYDGNNSIDVGHSGTPFGNNHYISGACFGKDENTVYYSKATSSKADGAHELHKVKIVNGTVDNDEIITEASMCILRPLFLGNGELATVVGHYNDQNSDGTYNGSFTAWELKPLFCHA